jgi:hypothetical protein
MVISKTAKQYKSLANPLLIKTDQSFLSLQYFMQVYMFITGVNNISIISVYWGNFLCTSSVTWSRDRCYILCTVNELY